MTHALHWFRADLRISDNRALQAAMQASSQLTALFILTPDTWKTHACSSSKLQFTLGCLRELSVNLAKQSVPLIIRQKPTFSESVAALIQLCSEHEISHVYFNKQYELDEIRRDEVVIDSLTSLGIQCHSYDDQTIVPPGKILTQSHEPYKVFTAFKKVWLKEVVENIHDYCSVSPINKSFIKNPKLVSSNVPEQIAGFKFQALSKNYFPGEMPALKQLERFSNTHLENYHLQRDFPALVGTSKLSPALTVGALSPRQCLGEVIRHTKGKLYDTQKFPGALTWLSELVWRDFYKHIIYYYPHLCRYQPYKPLTDQLPWKKDDKLLRAWQAGKTGFPLVDAAMRQLNQTGWMHNRLRMVTAMFLSKTLFLDWRLGEKYFMENLIDGDFSANNGGWQWCASTGTDAVPYFRIFNPTTQSERFDKDGEFIRTFCPELASLTNKQIHAPYERGVDVEALNYPKPIVDYKAMRAYVIEQFKGY